MKNQKFQFRRLLNTVARLSHRLFVSGVVCLLVYWPLPKTTQASSGDLDPTFGSGGKVTTNFFNIPGVFFSDHASAVAVQSDGKIVAAGFAAGAQTNFNDNFAIARYMSNGSLDSSFGSGGKVSTDFSGNGGGAFAVAIQPDGKIIAAGGSGGKFALARYKTNGSLDMTFGNGGKVTTSFFNIEDAAAAVAIQSDSKIVVAGSARSPATTYDFAVARYNTNGTLDASFGSGGKVTTDFFGNADQALAVALQSDGKIVTAGLAFNISTDDDFALTRYNIDGTVDSTFGSGGKVTTDIAGFFDVANGVAIQSDGKIVAGGDAVKVPSSGGVLTRYNPDGSLDTTFGTGGKVFNDFFGNASAVAIQPNGKIVAAGTAIESGKVDFGLTRFNSNGSPDLGFGSGGKVTTNFLGNVDRALAIAIQPDGKIVAAGMAYDISANNESFALARYDGDGPIFDICIQDDSNRDILKFNSTTGDYQFTSCGSRSVTLSGKAKVKVKKAGCLLKLTSNQSDHSLAASINICRKTGSASIQVTASGRTFDLSDGDITNNTCTCP
jgi:uncharacterized delta-60 repeat protein